MSRKVAAFLQVCNADDGLLVSWHLGTPFFQQVEHGELDPAALPFRLLRRDCTDFVWGSDYAEFFDGLSPADAEIVFEGTLPPINRRKYEWLDRAVTPWHTYAYWVVCELSPAAGPAPVRRVDHRAWWPRERIEAEMRELAAKYADQCVLRDCGTTCLGTPLEALAVGNIARPVALVGATHAGEAGPEIILGVLRRLLERDRDLLSGAGVVALPVVNADARERLLAGTPWYGRVSAAGVDLNRNFPAAWEEVDYSYGLVSADPQAMTYRGRAPGSETETRAVMSLLEAFPPQAVFSYHCLGSITGAGFLTARAAADDAPYAARARQVADAYLRGFSPVGQGPVPRRAVESQPVSPSEPARIHYACTAGSLPAWVYDRFGVPAFDLEKGSDHPAEVAAVTCSMTPEMLEEYQERHYRGAREALGESPQHQ